MGSEAGDDHDLSAALDLFDRAESNLVKLQNVWREIQGLTPAGYLFGEDTPRRNELVRSFEAIAKALPAVQGFCIDKVPMSADAIAQARLDVAELGEPAAEFGLERDINEPGEQVAEYGYRLRRSRKGLIRDAAWALVEEIDQILRDVEVSGGTADWKGANRWAELSDAASALDRMVSNLVSGHARWTDLRRHLSFGMSNDLADIVNMDWPSVRAQVEPALYEDDEPIPVPVDDLGALAAARPRGPVSTRLPWERLAEDDFEGLLYELVSQTASYENANWLMKTRAADHGRDIEVYRIHEDPLMATRRERVIIQCKHWLTKTVGRDDLVLCVEAIKLWEPPKVDTLIVASSGRFSADAVTLAERRIQERTVPAIDLWPDSHLETLLARRPTIAAAFGLR